jgi:hypothetical protein
MSAHETLVTTLTNLLAVSRRGRMDAHRTEAERLVDAVLHEAAEEIRENTRARLTRVTSVHGADWGRTWAYGRECAADLVDPEVS